MKIDFVYVEKIYAGHAQFWSWKSWKWQGRFFCLLLWKDKILRSQFGRVKLIESQLIKSQQIKSQLFKSQLIKSQLIKSQLFKSQLIESQQIKSQLIESQLFESQLIKKLFKLIFLISCFSFLIFWRIIKKGKRREPEAKAGDQIMDWEETESAVSGRLFILG